MQLNDRITIETDVRSALKIFVLYGTANGSQTFQFYQDIQRALGINSFYELGDEVTNLVSDKIGSLDYLNIQEQIEEAFLETQKKGETLALIKTLEAQIAQLKESIE